MKTNFAILLVGISLLNVVCQNKPTVHATYYTYEIVQEDSLYFMHVRFSLVDSVSGTITDGIVENYEGMFLDWDHSVIQFDKNQIIPQSVGVSKVIIQFPNGVIDSLKVKVDKEEDRLVLSIPLPA